MKKIEETVIELVNIIEDFVSEDVREQWYKAIRKITNDKILEIEYRKVVKD